MKYRPQRTERDITAGGAMPKRTTTAPRLGNRTTDVRHSGAWKQLRERFKMACAAEQLPCWQCRQPIDYHTATRTPHSFECDHVVPVSVDPALALVWSNLRPSHARCNQARRDDKPPAQDEWVQPNW
jgi:hypothetical protein